MDNNGKGVKAKDRGIQKKKKKYPPIHDEKGFLHTLEQWKNLFKRPPSHYIPILLVVLALLIILLIGASLLVVFLYIIGKSIVDVFYRNFGEYNTRLYTGLIFASLLYASVVLFTFLLFLLGKLDKKKKWFYICAGVMIFAFIFGIFGIDTAIGNRPLELNLFYKNNSIAGKISCLGDSGIVLTNERAICSLEDINLSNVSIEIKLFYNNSLINFTLFEDQFIAPEDVKYVGFRVIGLNNQNKQVELTAGYPYKFLTEGELKENREKFLAYILGLLAIIFITIPSAVVNFRELLTPTRES